MIKIKRKCKLCTIKYIEENCPYCKAEADKKLSMPPEINHSSIEGSGRINL